MPDYNIYVLDESDLTLSGGQLDGLDQGDGSHLVGETLTINASNWYSVAISDGGDSDFRDNDGNQTLNGAQTIDGVLYSDGTRVEAEYSLTLTDGTDTWTVVGFNVNNSSPAYGTVEGLAFIGGPGGFPPVGVPLTISAAGEGPNFEVSEYATPICFARGTRVMTPGGLRRVETLGPGRLVQTRDNGFQPVLWIGQSQFPAVGPAAPIKLRPGALGNERALVLSPNHRVLLTGWRAEMLFGEPEVLAPAAALRDDIRILRQPGGTVEYVHLAFERHEVILSEDLWTESLLPGSEALFAMSAQARAALETVLCTQNVSHRAARPLLRVRDVAALP